MVIGLEQGWHVTGLQEISPSVSSAAESRLALDSLAVLPKTKFGGYNMSDGVLSFEQLSLTRANITNNFPLHTFIICRNFESLTESSFVLGDR